MRFFMFAAALSVVALGFTGCAMTRGGGCAGGGCDAGVVSDCGCSDSGCSDCQSSAASDCGCEAGGGKKLSLFGDMTGIHGGAPSGDYGGGVTNTDMAMTMFDRGSKCGGGSGGCPLMGGGCLASRVGGGRLRAGLQRGAGGGEVYSEEIVEAAPGRGLLGKLKDANAIALADQDAQFASAGGGCGAPGCGAGGCAACVGGIVRHAVGHPYGGAVPHTTPPQTGPGGGAGMAPTYAYPYYTTRGPRDFLAREPMSIGY